MPITGREATLAFGIYTSGSWGVPTSVTARVLFDSDRGLTSQVGYVDDGSFGQSFLGPADVGDFAPVDVTLTGQVYFDHFLHRLEACAMGSPNAVTVVSSQAANSLVAYQHIIDLAPNTNGRGITMAADKAQYVEELTSAKVYGVGMSIGQNGVLASSFRLKGGKSTITSAVNTRSAVTTSATAVTISNRVLRQNGAILMNITSAGSLTPGTDTISTKVVDVSIDFMRPLDEAMVHGQNYTAEPLDNGHPEVTVRFGMRSADTITANSLYTAVQAGTPFKMRATYTGAYINSTTPRSYEWEFPYLEARTHQFSVDGAVQSRPEVTFVAKQASSAPTGFSHTRPCRLTRITTQSLIAF